MIKSVKTIFCRKYSNIFDNICVLAKPCVKAVAEQRFRTEELFDGSSVMTLYRWDSLADTTLERESRNKFLYSVLHKTLLDAEIPVYPTGETPPRLYGGGVL